MINSTQAILLSLLVMPNCTLAASHKTSKNTKEQIYVYKAKGQETESIILRPNKEVFYGHGGRYGARHKFKAGEYRIKGNIITLYEYNGHKYVNEGNQTLFPFTPKTIDAGMGKIYRRL